MKKLNSIQFYGMPLPIYAFFAIIVLACAYFNIIPNQMIGAVAVLFAFGILIGEIGERLPIWNKFLGGGAMLCFLAAGLLKYFNLLPCLLYTSAVQTDENINRLLLIVTKTSKYLKKSKETVKKSPPAP